MSEHTSPFADILPGPGKRPVRHPLSPDLEVEFELLFGDEAPPVRPGPNPLRAAWEAARATFGGIVEPPRIAGVNVGAAMSEYAAYNFSAPVFFLHTVGVGRVLARFAGVPIDHNPDYFSVLFAPWQVIAAAQVHQIKNGIFVLSPHFRVPDKYKKANEELRPRPEGSSE